MDFVKRDGVQITGGHLNGKGLLGKKIFFLTRKLRILIEVGGEGIASDFVFIL